MVMYVHDTRANTGQDSSFCRLAGRCSYSLDSWDAWVVHCIRFCKSNAV
jgi:hypothetical protein